MIDKIKSLHVLSIFWGLVACSDDNNQLPERAFPLDVEFRHLLCPERGGSSAIPDTQEVVINDENNYLHQIEISDLRFNDDVPEVDFEIETVIAVSMGQRNSSGHKIEIVDITEQQSSITVQYDLISPPQDCLTNDVLTSPYCMVAIPKVEKNVIFEANQFQQCGISFMR